MYTQHFTDTSSKLAYLADQLGDNAGFIDPEFDAETEELERQFAELRLTFNHI